VLRVAADLTSFLTPRTGVGVFATEVVEQLAGRDGVETTGFAVTWKGRGGLADQVPAGVRVVDRPMPARPLRILWKRFDHPRIDHWIGRHDVVWGPNFVVPPSRAAEVVTVHDLTPVRFPQLANRATLAYPALIRRAVRRGAWIHTPSAFVRDEVLAEFRASPERVVAIHHGVRPTGPDTGTDPVTVERERITGRRLAGGDRYVLAVGTVEPRKDLPTLVRAFDALAGDDEDLRLVIAGPDGWGTEALDSALARTRHRDRVVRLGWVSDDDRWALLRAATVFCFPSVYEGFGLPPLEAMTYGVPVVATRAGAVPEVCRNGADLVPVGDPDGLAEALGRVLTDDGHRDRLIVRGHVVAAGYRWPATADAIVDLFERAVKDHVS
jgi:glycosyltransferase involved in cell wall biosynthesis